MNQNTEQSDEDEGLEELLRVAGAREEPAADTRDEVRAVVHAQWRAMLEERSRRRRWMNAGIAASVAAIAITVGAVMRIGSVPSTPVASIVRVEGTLEVDPAGVASWQERQVGDRILTGDMLRTNDATRVALSFEDGLSLRLDNATSLRLAGVDRVVLEHGAVYVDVPEGADVQGALQVETPVGTVRHVGTQYLVRALDDSMEISVREGRVVIAARGATSAGSAGERLVVSKQGAVTRQAIAPADPQWGWISHIAPRFDIENRRLSDFLSWFSRETGRSLAYATPQIQVQADTIVLRGTNADLSPEQTLAAVMATTPFAYTVSERTIEIRMQ
jgi:ferric-dicitrate binding protein FerR (iron transport regulator)